jgi:hypothetical protein
MTFTTAMAMVDELPSAISINGVSYSTAGAGADAQQAVARLMFLQSELQRLAALMEELNASRSSVLEQLQVVLAPA